MSRLPYGYTEAIAIESDGASLISTGVGWQTHPRIVLDIQSPGGVIFGNYHTSTRRLYGGANVNCYYGSKIADYSAVASYANARALIDCSDTELKINGYTIATYDATGASGVSAANGPIRLLGQKGAGGTSYSQSGSRIYSAKIYKKVEGVEACVFDGVPCVRNADGVAGIYDLITGTFKAPETGTPVAVGVITPSLIDNFWLDGSASANSAATYGIRLQKEITFEGAEPNVETVSVPGRNGDILLRDGNFKNVKGTASCYCLAADASAAIRAVNTWLLTNTDYRRLETLHEPDFFRLARVTHGAVLYPRLNRLNAFDIEFDCKPQKYYKSGETAIAVQIATSTALTNPSFFPAQPIIRATTYTTDLNAYFNLTGDVAHNFTVNLASVTPGLTIEIDVEKRTVTAGGIHIEHLCEGYFEYLQIGRGNNIYISGGVSSAEIVPRWWTL